MEIRLSDHFTYKRLIRFTLPSILMLIFTSVYSVVDGLFVSNILGKIPFAAVNLVMPFTMLLGAVGFMIGTGGTALVSKKLGEGDGDGARRCFTLMVVFTLLLGVVISAAGFLLMRPVSVLMGASPDMVDDCVLYGRVLCAFNAAFMLQVLFHSFCAAAERPGLGLFATVSAGVMNMLLDALFIAVFKWGIVGAAAATGVSQLVGALIPMVYFRKKGRSQLWFVRPKLEFSALAAACTNGISEFLSSVAGSVSGMAYNLRLMRYAGEDGVATYGVLMYVNFIFIAVFIGYSVGSAPIIGFHYGAGNRSELKSLLKKSGVMIGITGVVMTALALLLSKPLARVFVGYDDGLTAMTVRAFRMFAPSFLAAGGSVFVSAFFTALNNGLVSAAVSVLRTLVFAVGAVLLLPLILGTDGIWLSHFASESAALITSMVFLFANRKKYGYM